MKKLRNFVALLALVLLPIKANAAATLEYAVSEPDANGVYTVQIFEKVTQGDSVTDFKYDLIAQHNLIQTISGTTEWTINTATTTQGTNLTSAHIETIYNNITYTGTGERVKVVEFTYVHDPSYTGDEEHKLTITPDGGTAVEITEKTTTSPTLGSFISYVGIAIGVVLIGAAYIISRKSTKLYKI